MENRVKAGPAAELTEPSIFLTGLPRISRGHRRPGLGKAVWFRVPEVIATQAPARGGRGGHGLTQRAQCMNSLAVSHAQECLRLTVASPQGSPGTPASPILTSVVPSHRD